MLGRASLSFCAPAKKGGRGEDWMLNESGPHAAEDSAPRDESCGLGEPPVDLVHLARQCQGDPALEQELLHLFRRLAPVEAARLSDPLLGLGPKADLAHKLRGSALAIGAGRVARAAWTIEHLARAPGGEPPSREHSAEVESSIRRLGQAVAEAIAAIEQLLG
jgi:HPt (histidine-containing phosphotransfer) domain-containing protein